MHLPIKFHFGVEGFSSPEFHTFKQLAHSHGIASIDEVHGVLADFHTCMDEDDFDKVGACMK